MRPRQQGCISVFERHAEGVAIAPNQSTLVDTAKLSKENSKFGGRTGKSSERMPAPTLVISVTQHDRTPFCPPKNSKPPLSILVLAIDLRSFVAIMRALHDAQPIRRLCRPWMTIVGSESSAAR